MRFFKQPIAVLVGHDVLERAKSFSEKVAPTVGIHGIYTDTNQSNLEKIRHDHYVSKVGEEAVKQVLQQLGKTIKGPDYEIYQGKQKSWASDLWVDGVDLAVKTQTKDLANRFGLSWTFQASRQRRDPILDKPDAWVCFVKFDQQKQLCDVYPPYQIKELEFGEPVLVKLKGTKKVVYAQKLPVL